MGADPSAYPEKHIMQMVEIKHCIIYPMKSVVTIYILNIEKESGRKFKRLWLFNITDDPNERRDLSLARPDAVVMMKNLMKTFEYIDPISHHPNPKK